MGAMEGRGATGAHPCLPCPAPLALGAPGCSLCLMSPAATCTSSLTRAASISSPVKTRLVRRAKQRVLQPSSPAGNLQKTMLLPCAHQLPWFL